MGFLTSPWPKTAVHGQTETLQGLPESEHCRIQHGKEILTGLVTMSSAPQISSKDSEKLLLRHKDHALSIFTKQNITASPGKIGIKTGFRG